VDISLSLSGKKEGVVAELRGVTPRDINGVSKSTPVTEMSHGEARGVLGALASYIELNAVNDTDVSVSLSGGVILTQIDHEG
jgi:hypothetical protein